MDPTPIPDLPSVFRPAAAPRMPASLLVGRWDLWDALPPSARDYTALARSFLELSGPAAGSPLVRRQNLIHLGLLVRAGAPICWEAPLYTNRSDFASELPALGVPARPFNPSLFAVLAEAVELTAREETAKSLKNTKNAKAGKAPPRKSASDPAPFTLLAAVWKQGQAERGWSWNGPAADGYPRAPAVPSARNSPEELWETAVRYGLWSFLRLSPEAVLANRFATSALTTGCMDQDWWVSFVRAAAHRPDWSDGRDTLARQRGAALWAFRSPPESLDWLRVAQGDLDAEPGLPPGPVVPNPPPFLWDRATATLVLRQFLARPAQSVEKLTLSVAPGVTEGLRMQSGFALAYASASTRSQMLQSKARKVPAVRAESIAQAISAPPPPGRGWAIWDVLHPEDVEHLVIQPGHHGLWSLVAEECRKADLYGGAGRVGGVSGADTWAAWLAKWPMDRTPTAWLCAELDVVAAESQKAYRSTGPTADFIPRVMVRQALSEELTRRLFHAATPSFPEAPPAWDASAPVVPDSDAPRLFHAALDALSVSAAPGDFLIPYLIRSGQQHPTSWPAAAQAAGGWPFASAEGLQRLIDRSAPSLPEKGTSDLVPAGSKRALAHQDSRAFRVLTASWAVAPLDDLVPHLAGLPDRIERFSSGWSARMRTDVALLFFLRAAPLPRDDPRRPHLIQAAWTAACLAATGASADRDSEGNVTSQFVVHELERIFVRYGNPDPGNPKDRRAFLGPFADPDAFLPLLKKAAAAVMSSRAVRTKNKVSPVRLEQVFLRLTAAATTTSAPARAPASRRL